MIDNLEHGWIVDGVELADECKQVIHCQRCWKDLMDGDYKYKGFGKYICNNCLSEESE
jgi:hypothetical protein